MAKQKFHPRHNSASINILNKFYLYRRYLGSKIKYGTSFMGFGMLVLGLLCRHISFFMIHTVSCQDTSSFFFFNRILATITSAPDLGFRACGTLNLNDLYDLGQFCAKASSMFHRITILYINPYAVGAWSLFVLCKSDPL